MKAIRIHEFGPPEVMRAETASDPQPTKPDQAVVQIKAVGVNPVDTYIRSGNYAIKKELPFTPGLDAAGIVLKVGPDVKTLRPGQRVYTSGSVSGTYAEQALCPAGRVHPLPDNITFEQGAALGVPYGTAWRGVFQRGRAVSDQWVLIHGASGGVGIAAVQIAAAAGMQVVATAGSEAGRLLAKEQGAHYVFDHSDPAHMNKILDLTKGVHVVLEMLANVNLDQDLDIMAKGGRVVIIGSRGRIEIDPRKAMSRELDIRGLMMMNASPDELKEIYAGIEKGLQEGKLNPVIGKRFPLDQAPLAHHEIMESPHRGKIILLP